MPMYELVCLARHLGARLATQASKDELVALMRSVATFVMDRQGVVKGFDPVVSRELPYAIKKHGTIHTNVRPITMQYFASSNVKTQLESELRYDERVVRFANVKLADRL
ncbi:30S ribosomal protein S6, partial [Caulochytrium protostelioides]